MTRSSLRHPVITRPAAAAFVVAALATATLAPAMGAQPAARPPAVPPAQKACVNLGKKSKADERRLRALATPRQPAYELRQLPADSVAALRAYLLDRCWPEALHLAVSNYQPELPAWMVYIDGAGTVRQTFLSRNDTKVRLRSQRYIWAMVFMDRRMVPPPLPAESSVVFRTRDSLWNAASKRAAAADAAAQHEASAASAANAFAVTAHNSAAEAFTRRLEAAAAARVEDSVQLRVARRTQVFQADPVLTTLVKGIGKAFGVSGPPDAPRLDDSVKFVAMRQISAEPTRDSMWMGFQRFSLVENSVVELALSPAAGKQFPPPEGFSPPPPQLRSVYANLANARERTFELGIVAGVTRGRPTATYDGSLRVTQTSPKTAVNGYLTAIINPYWFQLPWRDRQKWRRASLGGFIGTNVLNGTIGDEPILGIAVGHLVSDAGLSLGTALVQEPRLDDGRVARQRKPRILAGIDLRF